MAALLFKLHNVPEDEAEEVRQLLREGGFEIYETNAGRWQSGVAAIWLTNPEQLADARALLENYQTERVMRIRQEYEELRTRGQAPTFWSKLVGNPVLVVAYLIAASVLLALMTLPFVGFLG